MKKGRPRLPGWIRFSLPLLLACVACSDSDPEGPDGVIGTTKEVRITSGHDCMMMMGKGPDASLYFPYDGRGPGSLGRMSLDCSSLKLDAKNLEACRALEADLVPGEAIIFFDADDSLPSKFYLVNENLDVYINILPTDMIGTVNFCTGALEYAFDAQFEQVVFGKSQGALSIVSVLATEQESA